MASNFVDKQVVKFVHQVSSPGTFASTTDVDIANDVVTVAAHGLKTGDPVHVTTSSALPTGLSVDTAYYAIVTNSNQIGFATSVANAIAGTKVDITAVGTGTQTVYKNGMGTINLGVLPKNFIITDCFYDVITTYVTAGSDAGTLALSAASAGDLKAAIAVSDASNVWDAGLHGCLPGSYAEATVAGDTAILDAARRAASLVKTSANAQVTCAIATKGASAGKLNLYIEGYISE